MHPPSGPYAYMRCTLSGGFKPRDAHTSMHPLCHSAEASTACNGQSALTVDGWVRFLLQWLGVELVALCMPRKGVVCLQSGLEHSSSRPCPGVSLDNLWDAVQSGGLSAYVAMLSGLQWPAGLLSRVVATLGWAVECGPLPSSCRVRVAPPCCKGRCLYGVLYWLLLLLCMYLALRP
jgi:hypothetical protein